MVLALGMVALGLSGCLTTPGRTDQIERVSSTSTDGWTWTYYRNRSYPCAISGYQTFIIGTQNGTSPTAPAPLWVKMHGGGVGWFNPDGTPAPTAGQKTEESRARLLDTIDRGLTAKASRAGFRILSVSMCDHDLYSGTGGVDPNNPNTQPDGSAITTNGLLATKAAIAFTKATFPTTKFFLHGTSAGGVGAFSVGWGLQLEGEPPAGIVSDSGVLNLEFEQARIAQGLCTTGGRDADSLPLIAARLDPFIANIDNEPDKLVTSGRLNVPIMNVYNKGDKNPCGTASIQCPMRDGSTQTMWAAMCRHEPIRAAIANLPTPSRSANVVVCVEGGDAANPCDRHVVTTAGNLRNTDPDAPADFNNAIWSWVKARLADS
jgi:hypothetical protein